MSRMTSSRHALLILGMHRSGTSALTRLINIYGAALPTDLLPANAGNVTGYWEPSAIVRFHDRVLEAAGSQWDDPLEISPTWFATDDARTFSEELAAILAAEFGDATLFVVKDPRTCRLVPLWRQALARIGATPIALLLVRHPLEVETSLQRRDNRPDGSGLALWLQHVISAEADTRDLKRAVLTYDQMLADFRGTIERVETTIGAPLPLRGSAEADAEAARFLDPALRHQRAEQARSRADARLLQIARETYAWFEHASQPGTEADTAALDAVRRDMRQAENILGSAIRWARRQEQQWLAVAREEASRCQETRVQHGVIAAELHERTAEADRARKQWQNERADLTETIGRIESELGDARADAARLQAELGEARTDATRLRAELGDTRTTLADVRADAASLRAELALIEASVWGRLRRWTKGASSRP